MVYSDNLASMVGRVRQVKPNAPQPQIRDQINDRIRFLMDSQPFWADLVVRSVLAMPAAYAIGTVDMVTASKVVLGHSTAWPVADRSDTTVASGIRERSIQAVTPADMTGIETDSFLYIDSAGDAEAVAVLSTTRTSFTANFTKLHNPNFTVTQSTLAGLQFRLGVNYPTYTVRAIHSATELEVDIAWGLTPLTGSSYQILKCYFSIAPDLKDIINVWDPQQGRPMIFHKVQDWLNNRDPQRSATGVPIALVDLSPNESGSMQYELWPHQTIPYQIPILYARQWPELKNQTDKPPMFINPSMIIDGAIADALRVRNPLGPEQAVDPFFDPKTAQIYESKFQAGLEAALNANESKSLTVLQQYSDQWGGFMPGGTWNQSHVDPGDYPGYGGYF